MYSLFSQKLQEHLRKTFNNIGHFTNPKNFANWPNSWKGVYYKKYDRHKKINLKKYVDEHPKVNDLFDVVTNRHSCKSFANLGISATQLSNLLYYGAGIRKKNQSDDKKLFRHYPSGGASYPLEIYLVLNKTSSVEIGRGVYHYNVEDHELETIGAVGDVDLILSLFEYQNVPLLVFIGAVWERSAVKYLDFGYNLTLIECGHLAHNLIMVGQALDLSSYSSTSFDANKIESALDLVDYKSENIIYSLAFGVEQPSL